MPLRSAPTASICAVSCFSLLVIACGPAADPPEDASSVHHEHAEGEHGQAVTHVGHKPTVVVMQCPAGTIAVKGEPNKTETVVVTDDAVITTPEGTHTVVTHDPLPPAIAAQCTPIANPAPVVQATPVVVAPKGIHWAVKAEVREHYPKFRRCYEKGLRRNPNLAGKVVVRMKVDSDGEVDEAYNWGSTLPDLKVVRCIVDEYEDMDFDTYVGREVVYPLDFTPSVAG